MLKVPVSRTMPENCNNRRKPGLGGDSRCWLMLTDPRVKSGSGLCDEGVLLYAAIYG